MAAFRAYLRETYGELEGLNREWETSFTKWNDVEPLVYEDAYAKGNLAPWADHRLFMNRDFTRFHVEVQDEVRTIQPGAFVGEEGAPGFGAYSGFDESENRALSLQHSYYARYTQWKLTRDLAPRHAMRGYWTGWYFHLLLASPRFTRGREVKCVYREKRHVYDCLNEAGQHYLGNTNTVSRRIPTTRAAVYALLPYRVNALEVDLAPGTIATGRRGLTGKVQRDELVARNETPHKTRYSLLKLPWKPR